MIQKISAPVKSILLFVLAFTLFSRASYSQLQTKLKNKDRKKDIEFVTMDGTIILRLSDSTPLHRDIFLRLVKSHFYDSLLFHRVILYFMIQAGDRKAGMQLPDRCWEIPVRHTQSRLNSE